MTRPRLLALGAVLVVPGLLAATAPTAEARPAVGGPDRCLARGPIPLAAVAYAAREGCSLVGRMVTDGRVSVMVPPPGMTAAGDGVGRHGDVEGLRVTNTGTTVRALRSGPGVAGKGWYLAPLPTSTAVPTATPVILTASPAATAAATTACQDRTFHLEHHRWNRSLRFRVNLSKMPARFAKRTVTRQIVRANHNMRLGRNTCGRPRLATPRSRYLGHTTVRPDIRPGGPTCGKANTDNVVGFGNLPGGLLGWTCYWFYGTGRMAGADIVIDNGHHLATALPTSCTATWDFEGTVTHEWGHAYGMAHTGPGHPELTMQHELTPCSTYARTLGLGDWLGMNKMYGHRS